MIDVEKSIKTERLTYQATLGQLLWTYFSSFAGCFGTIAFFYLLLLNTFYKDYSIQVVFFLILLTVFVFINGYFIDKLYVVKGIDENSNSALLTKILQDNYRNIRIDNSNPQVVIGKTNSSFWAFDRNFTILFDNEYIAINLSVFGRGDMKYCLIGLYNYYKCRKILNKIKQD